MLLLPVREGALQRILAGACLAVYGCMGSIGGESLSRIDIGAK
jgi:hypothetical protein